MGSPSDKASARHESIRRYMQEHAGENVTTRELREEFGCGSADITNSINFLRRQHRQLKWPSNGTYRWESRKKPDTASAQPHLPESVGLDDIVRAIMELTKAVEAQTYAMVNTGIIMK